jgi:hypothetical protein
MEENDKKGKRRTTMGVAGDEKRVGYRCSDETSVGVAVEDGVGGRK